MKKLYTRKELFDIYKVCAMANITKASPEELLQRDNPRLLDKTFYLERCEREIFIKILYSNVEKYDKLFRSIPKNISNDMEYEQMKKILSDIQTRVLSSMEEYIKD